MSQVVLTGAGQPVSVYPPIESFQAIAAANFPIGTPVVAEIVDGVSKVTPADSTSAPHVIGLAAEAGVEGEQTTIQTGGYLRLSYDQWLVVDPTDTRPATGLALYPGKPYYLQADGVIQGSAPSASGTYVNQVGIAFTPTVMKITIGMAVGPHA
jgi:hypothetical protein